MYRLCSMRARESKCSEGRRAYDDLLSHLTRVRESKCKKDEPIKQLKRRTSRGCENRNHHKKASVAKIAPKHGCGN